MIGKGLAMSKRLLLMVSQEGNMLLVPLCSRLLPLFPPLLSLSFFLFILFILCSPLTSPVPVASPPFRFDAANFLLRPPHHTKQS